MRTVEKGSLTQVALIAAVACSCIGVIYGLTSGLDDQRHSAPALTANHQHNGEPVATTDLDADTGKGG